MRVAIFSMLEVGHLQRLRPLIADLSRRGHEVHVFTDTPFRDHVERAGGRFVDVFRRYPIEAADDESTTIPCRYVSFAGTYMDDIVRELEELRPDLIVHSTFAAVVAAVAARKLGVPYVNVCVGHNVHPTEFRPIFENSLGDGVGEPCLRAVEVLRERHGLEDANPFSWIEGLSPFLNLYCEPEGFLTDAERESFEPIAFYGSLAALEELEALNRVEAAPAFGPGHGPRVYVSFGTLIWRYFTEPALAAFRAVADAVESIPGARGLISLGGNDPGSEAVRSLRRGNVTVADYVDQWQVLRETDVCVTHNGMNTTHEAVFQGVPMVSYTFFADQPALARRCRQLGMAVPLAEEPIARVTADDARAALERVAAERDSMRARLAEAREWEIETIGARDAVIERLVALAGVAA